MGACLCKPPVDADPSNDPGKYSAKALKPPIPDFGYGEALEVKSRLGSGAEGETWLCYDKEKAKDVAVKVITRPIPDALKTIVHREFSVLADLGDGHLNIVHAHEVLLSKSHVGLAMEYMAGGNMVDYVSMRRATAYERGGLSLDEDEARYFFKQLIYAVQFCHQRRVAHRDLKLDNTLLDDRHPPRIKLCDFGFAKSWGMSTSVMNTVGIGTFEYMGPELINGRHGYDGTKVDVWASGVLLFVMLMGAFPFEVEVPDESYQNTATQHDLFMQQVRTSWRDQATCQTAVKLLSPELLDLLDKVFEVKQDRRITIEGILAHPWVAKPLPQQYQAALADLEQEQHQIDTDLSCMSRSRAKARNQALQGLLDRACQKPQADEQLLRVSLLHSSYHGASDTIEEEGQV